MKLAKDTIALLLAVFFINSVAMGRSSSFSDRGKSGFSSGRSDFGSSGSSRGSSIFGNRSFSSGDSKKGHGNHKNDGSEGDKNSPQEAFEAKKEFLKGNFSKASDLLKNNKIRFNNPEFSAVYILSLLYCEKQDHGPRFLEHRLEFYADNTEELGTLLNKLLDYNKMIKNEGYKNKFALLGRERFAKCIDMIEVSENDTAKFAKIATINVRIKYEFNEIDGLDAHIEEAIKYSKKNRAGRKNLRILAPIVTEVYQGLRAFGDDFGKYKKASINGNTSEMLKLLANAKIKDIKNINVYAFELPVLQISGKSSEYTKSLGKLLEQKISFKKLPSNIRQYFMAKMIIEKLSSAEDKKANVLLQKALKRNLYRTDSLVNALITYDNIKGGKFFKKLNKKLMIRYMIKDFSRSSSPLHKALVADSLSKVYSIFEDSKNKSKMLRLRNSMINKTAFGEKVTNGGNNVSNNEADKYDI